MKITAQFWKNPDDHWWIIEIPFLDVATQAETREEILEMTKDVIETLVGDPGFTVEVAFMNNEILINASDSKKLVALILKRQRQRNRLRLEDVAKQLDAKSLNEYAQYEQGKHMPSFDKFQQLLEAIDPHLSPYLCLAKR